MNSLIKRKAYLENQYLEGIYNTVLVKDVLTRKKLNDVTLVKSMEQCFDES